MTFYILDGAAPQRAEVQRVKQNLIKALDDLQSIDRQLDEMADADVESQYGVPTAAVTAFRTVMGNALTAMNSTSVINIISSLGFDT